MNDGRDDPETAIVIGAAMEVHNQLGHGFAEPVYQEALAIEFATRGIRHRREPELIIIYKGAPLKCTYRPDFICHQSLIVELKALKCIGGDEYAQVINYLKVTGYRRGLLLNFGSTRLGIKRLVFDAHLCASVSSVDRSASSNDRGTLH